MLSDFNYERQDKLVKDLIVEHLWQMLKTNGSLHVLYRHPTRGQLILAETYMNGHVTDIEYIEEQARDMILITATDEETGEVKTGLHPVCTGLRFK